MSFLDELRQALNPSPDLVRTDAPRAPALARGAIEDLIYSAQQQRLTDFGMEQALAMPAMARATQLITTMASSFHLVAYLDGTTAPEQPRFVQRPNPYQSRQEFVSQTCWAMLEFGEYFWRVGSKDSQGFPSFAMVLDNDEVELDWDQRRFQPVAKWRGKPIEYGTELIHGALGKRAGELHGRSVIRGALDELAVVDAAEAYAAESFGSQGIPTTVLKTMQTMTKDEATELRQQWEASRQESGIAVAGGGLVAEFPGVDPQKMQMQEARSYGATVVARLMGVPAALLHVETSGATITYTNPEGALDEFVKSTLVPVYLAPIEASMADLVPNPWAARFSLSELTRADVATRFAVYQQAIAAGVLLPEEARANEGLPSNPPPVESVHSFQPQPDRPEGQPSTAGVPAR